MYIFSCDHIINLSNWGWLMDWSICMTNTLLIQFTSWDIGFWRGMNTIHKCVYQTVLLIGWLDGN